MNFDVELKRQNVTELLVAQWLARNWGGLILPNPEGADIEKDFTIYAPQSVEVKFDEMAAKTGNLYFEAHNTKQGKPSGLRATKSVHWAHYVPGRSLLFFYKPRKMLCHLQEGDYRHTENAGDNNSAGWIVPIDIVRKFPFVAVREIDLSGGCK